MPEQPPIYLALDLWQALGLEPRAFDAFYERNGWATTWAILLDAVRTGDMCGEPIDGDEDCVLRAGHIGPHSGPFDVGWTEPLPSPRPTDSEPTAP